MRMLKYEDLQKICEKIPIPPTKASKNKHIKGKILPLSEYMIAQVMKRHSIPTKYFTKIKINEFRRGVIFRPANKKIFPVEIRIQPLYKLAQYIVTKKPSKLCEAGSAILKIKRNPSNENTYIIYLANKGQTTPLGIIPKKELQKGFHQKEKKTFRVKRIIYKKN